MKCERCVWGRSEEVMNCIEVILMKYGLKYIVEFNILQRYFLEGWKISLGCSCL